VDKKYIICAHDFNFIYFFWKLKFKHFRNQLQAFFEIKLKLTHYFEKAFSRIFRNQTEIQAFLLETEIKPLTAVTAVFSFEITHA